MLRPTTLALALGLSLVTPILATAQGGAGWFYDGNTLLERCHGAPSLAESYVMGTVDGIQYGGENATEYHGYRYCAPSTATSRQYRDIVCSYVEGHPATRHEAGASLVGEALFSAWPCVGLR